MDDGRDPNPVFDRRVASVLIAIFAPFRLLKNPGNSRWEVLKFHFWMLKEALRGGCLFSLQWDPSLNVLFPYKISKEGISIILNKDSSVSDSNGATVGSFIIGDGGSIIVGWQRPAKEPNWQFVEL